MDYQCPKCRRRYEARRNGPGCATRRSGCCGRVLVPAPARRRPKRELAWHDVLDLVPCRVFLPQRREVA
jgi:hypothetical protein